MTETAAALVIRPAVDMDWPQIWPFMREVIRAGETYALPRDMAEPDARAMWFADGFHVFVAVRDDVVLGTYTLHQNRPGGGGHVANASYMTAGAASGQGVAQAMAAHSMDQARAMGFRAMQFNFVVSSNERAVRLWHRVGFLTVGRVPGAFAHPVLGDVDALVMHRFL